EIHYYYYNLNKNYEKVWHIRHVRAQIAKAIENKNLEIQKFLGLTDIQFSDLISQAKKQKKQTKLTPREQLTLTLFHLHYSLSFQKLGFLFDVSEATARKWYKYWIELLDKQIQGSSQNTQKTGKEWIEEVLEPIYQKELKTA
ncbi:MAG: transposase family protein, partial [Cyanobacteria bacterium P01_E01_bin.42]